MIFKEARQVAYLPTPERELLCAVGEAIAIVVANDGYSARAEEIGRLVYAVKVASGGWVHNGS